MSPRQLIAMFVVCLLFVVGLLTSHASAACDDYNYADDCNLDATCYRPLIVHGDSKGSDGTSKDIYNIGERMSVVCNEDYLIRGDQEATCQGDFTWSWSVEPKCVPKPPPAAECTTLKEMASGMYALVNRTEKIGSIYSKIYVNCYVDEDYYLHGPGVYTCEGTTWKGNNFCLKRHNNNDDMLAGLDPQPASKKNKDKVLQGRLDSGTVIGIAFAAFIIGVLLTASLWYIHAHTCHGTKQHKVKMARRRGESSGESIPSSSVPMAV